MAITAISQQANTPIRRRTNHLLCAVKPRRWWKKGRIVNCFLSTLCFLLILSHILSSSPSREPDDSSSAKASVSHLNSTPPKILPAPPPPRSTTNSTVDAPPPRTLYTCGWARGEKFFRSLFPEYTTLKPFAEVGSETPINATDILVHGFTGDCGGKDERWIASSWPGRALIVNTEGPLSVNQIPSSLYRIGYEPDSARSVHILTGPMLVTLESRWYSEDDLESIIVPEKKRISTRKRFCIYAASNCISYRQEAADRISTTIDTVDCVGRCKGQNGTLLRDRLDLEGNTTWFENMRHFRDYRFCLVLENSNLEGYVTEKIMNAFLAGCIPIYYGTDEIFQIFNRKAFVFWDVRNPDPALGRIRYLESNQTAYAEMLEKEPILVDGNNTVRRYFSFVDDLGDGYMKRKIRTMLGIA